MTVAFKSPLTSSNLNAKLISRTTDQSASGVIDFENGIKIDGDLISKASGAIDIGGTGAIKLPDGNTAARPTAGNGQFRYNTQTNKFEGYENGSWTNFIGSAGNRSYRTANSTDSITTADDTVSYSGASFTATFPTAASSGAGKRYTICHDGTPLTQVYTLATTGGDTLGGLASGAYKLCTNETVTFESDGVSNFKVIDHKTSCNWIDAGTITIGATTTAPTKASGITLDKVRWRREGKDAIIQYGYRQSNTTSAAAGTGDYLFGLPSGIVADTTYIDLENTGAIGPGNFPSRNNIGPAHATMNTTNGVGYASLYSTTQFRILVVGPSDGGVVCGTLRRVTDPDLAYGALIRVPVVDWQP